MYGGRMFEAVKRLWKPDPDRPALHRSLESLRHHTPVPVFWLFGKTQSGKTSIIKFLTGADEAEIGEGFRPCTRTSRVYQFPAPEAPLISFLDTRGLDEPGYDASEDLARFNDHAHLVLVTVKLLDHALENLPAPPGGPGRPLPARSLPTAAAPALPLRDIRNRGTRDSGSSEFRNQR